MVITTSQASSESQFAWFGHQWNTGQLTRIWRRENKHRPQSCRNFNMPLAPSSATIVPHCADPGLVQYRQSLCLSMRWYSAGWSLMVSWSPFNHHFTDLHHHFIIIHAINQLNHQSWPWPCPPRPRLRLFNAGFTCWPNEHDCLLVSPSELLASAEEYWQGRPCEAHGSPHAARNDHQWYC